MVSKWTYTYVIVHILYISIIYAQNYLLSPSLYLLVTRSAPPSDSIHTLLGMAAALNRVDSIEAGVEHCLEAVETVFDHAVAAVYSYESSTAETTLIDATSPNSFETTHDPPSEEVLQTVCESGGDTTKRYCRRAAGRRPPGAAPERTARPHRPIWRRFGWVDGARSVRFGCGGSPRRNRRDARGHRRPYRAIRWRLRG